MKKTQIDRLIQDTLLKCNNDIYSYFLETRLAELPGIVAKIQDQTNCVQLKSRLLKVILCVATAAKNPYTNIFVNYLKEIYQQILFYQCLLELDLTVEHVVISIGSHNQPDQQHPPFAKNDKRKTVILNIDPVFTLEEMDQTQPSAADYNKPTYFFRFALKETCNNKLCAESMPRIYQNIQDTFLNFPHDTDIFSLTSLEHIIQSRPDLAITIMPHVGRTPSFTFFELIQQCAQGLKPNIQFISSYEDLGPVVLIDSDILATNHHDDIKKAVDKITCQFYQCDGTFWWNESHSQSSGINHPQVQKHLNNFFPRGKEKQEVNIGFLYRSLEYIPCSDLMMKHNAHTSADEEEQKVVGKEQKRTADDTHSDTADRGAAAEATIQHSAVTAVAATTKTTCKNHTTIFHKEKKSDYSNPAPTQ